MSAEPVNHEMATASGRNVVDGAGARSNVFISTLMRSGLPVPLSVRKTALGCCTTAS
jgi:hypothetical protein